jgi:DNA replication protein DnaC
MGTGKTLFASILLQEVISRAFVDRIQDEHDIRLKGRLSALFISEPALLNAITATWDRNSPEKMKHLVDRLSSKSILCIDDVGASISTHTHLLDLYANVIDERYKRKLPTIITTNLKHDDLKLAIGARSADRLVEKNRIIIANFDWSGYRSGEVGSPEIEMF